MTVFQLAKIFAESFESFTRPSAPQETQWRVKDSAPAWVHDIVRELHDGYLPNDQIFRLIRNAALFLVDNQGDKTPWVEPDIYNSDLLRWAGEDPGAFACLDDALVAYQPDSFFNLLQFGQCIRLETLYGRLRYALMERSVEEAAQ